MGKKIFGIKEKKAAEDEITVFEFSVDHTHTLPYNPNLGRLALLLLCLIHHCETHPTVRKVHFLMK